MGDVIKISSVYDQSLYVTGSTKSRRVDAPEGQPVDEGKSLPPEDKVSLSATSKDFQLAKEAVTSAPEIRSEIVEPIKQKIVEGKYQVNADEVAERMIGTYIDEQV